ncbi:MAG: hypothetical protein M3R03_11050 [Pseudomonadota bacterium]|nr:hypothetical protein [Pseudomonadota bacterium]
MRKLLIPAAILASTLAAAAPAAAQWAQPQGNAYGYQNNRGIARSYEVRINRLHQRIHRLGERGQLSRSEFSRLNRAVDVLENRLSRASYRGLNRQEAYQIERDLARLERAIYRDARDGRGFRDHHSRAQNGYGQYGNDQFRNDRDRDGRDDRYEDDRGRDHDGRRDRHDDDDD